MAATGTSPAGVSSGAGSWDADDDGGVEPSVESTESATDSTLVPNHHASRTTTSSLRRAGRSSSAVPSGASSA